MPPPQPSNTDDRLLRGIGRWALTAFAINLTVGSGILGLPAKIQALVGNYSVLIIIACGLLMALIALCFAEVGSRFDRTGGPQLYASQALGSTTGFTVGWLLWISRIGSCAAVSNLAVDYGMVLWPQLAHPGVRALAIALLVLGYTWINIRGIRQTAAVNTTFTVLKIVPLVAFVAIGLFFVEPQALRLGYLPATQDLSTAILLAAYAFVGFDGTTVLAGEVRDPRRSVPFAILFSVGCVIVLYTLIQLVCVGTLPDLANSERPLADVALLLAGPVGAIVIAVVAVISCAGVFGASMTPGTRLLFSMGDDRQLPHPLAYVHSRFRTPVIAILITAVAILALAISGSFIYLVKVTLIARLSIYAITCITLPIFRRRAGAPAAQFTLPGGAAVAVLSALLCVAFLANSSMRELLDVGVATVAGLAIYFITRRTLAPANREAS
ncbi:MAG TPA: APC family permease [Steroidobacteraceae bacterium]|nr:APC family permease [Steroidobacteraceae bacterium]